jgi:hypothetical protein
MPLLKKTMIFISIHQGSGFAGANVGKTNDRDHKLERISSTFARIPDQEFQLNRG